MKWRSSLGAPGTAPKSSPPRFWWVKVGHVGQLSHFVNVTDWKVWAALLQQHRKHTTCSGFLMSGWNRLIVEKWLKTQTLRFWDGYMFLCFAPLIMAICLRFFHGFGALCFSCFTSAIAIANGRFPWWISCLLYSSRLWRVYGWTGTPSKWWTTPGFTTSSFRM